MKGAALSVRNLTKEFASVGSAVRAVDDVSFDVASGEFFTMLGPSGCGKTTTLRVIAGLEQATAGRIMQDDRDFMALPPRRRNIGMVFQSYALFPHLTIYENVAYGLRLRDLPGGEIDRRVAAMLELLQLSPFARRHPSALSGGQQQRVSIARALVYEPTLLLLDEPLANLDAKLRVLMREEIRALQRRLGITTLYVTHDQEEATAVSDRVAVFDRGRLVQQGTPAQIYSAPESLFVADFIGRANFLPARLVAATDTTAGATLADGRTLRTARTVRLPANEVDRVASDDDAIVMIRPEHVELDRSHGTLSCRVLRVQLLGGVIRYTAQSDVSPDPIVVETTRALAGIEEGTGAFLTIAAEDAVLYHR